MSKPDKSPMLQKIDRKWVRESKRTFPEFPGMPRPGVLGEEEIWLELTQFYRDDLKWLLSLDHHKFWSHMIYSEKAHELLVSFLKGSPPNCLKRSFLVREDMKNVFKEIEHLVFLAFLRLSMEKESESCYVRNFREVIYNNYLFTVPIMLDICLIYGTSNHELVKRMINNVITSAPEFLDDFQEIIPHFIHVLKTVKEKLCIKNFPELGGRVDLKLEVLQDLVLYLCDTVETIEVFLNLHPDVCQLSSKGEIITEIVHFYSNTLPEMLKYSSDNCLPPSESSLVSSLIENVRVDLLKIVKSIFNFVLNESKEIQEKQEERANEYLSLIMKLLAEPAFLHDYNLMYSLEFEIGCAVDNCRNVDFVKVNKILEGVASANNSSKATQRENCSGEEVDVTGVKFDSLVTEIKDIFPHLEDGFIRQCLSYYNNSTERVIAAVLENSLPPALKENERKNRESKEPVEFKGKHKNKHKNLNEMLNDREEISKLKERYSQLSFLADETYDDEYDDTYDENVDFPLREGDESWRRPFVVPRVLRTLEYAAGAEDWEEEEEEEEAAAEEDEGEGEKGQEETKNGSGRDAFVENPAILRERAELKRREQNRRDVAGRGRGQGQSKQVLRNREFKESHKSLIANHNRKKQAGRKMARGMVPS